jgi:hypothetical protein
MAFGKVVGAGVFLSLYATQERHVKKEKRPRIQTIDLAVGGRCPSRFERGPLLLYSKSRRNTMGKSFRRSVVFITALALCLAGCSSPGSSGGGDPAREAADAFQATHAAALAKTLDTVAVGDEAAVDAALTAWEDLSADAKTLLDAEKTLLDSLAAKINELIAAQTLKEVADSFTAAHAAALARTPDTITVGDEATVDAALAAYAAYAALNPDATALLNTEKTLLDSLKYKIDALKATREAADAFQAAHAAALARTLDTVAAGDEAAVDGALTAWEGLGAEVKTLLGPEKTLLDSLKARIAVLKTLGTDSLSLEIWGANDRGLVQDVLALPVTIAKGAGEKFTIKAADNLDNIQWSLNGTAIPAPRGTAGEITIEAASYYAGASYTLSLYAKKDGIPYLINIPFVVNEN